MTKDRSYRYALQREQNYQKLLQFCNQNGIDLSVIKQLHGQFGTDYYFRMRTYKGQTRIQFCRMPKKRPCATTKQQHYANLHATAVKLALITYHDPNYRPLINQRYLIYKKEYPQSKLNCWNFHVHEIKYALFPNPTTHNHIQPLIPLPTQLQSQLQPQP